MNIKKNNLLNTYNRLPVSFQRGEGVWLYDEFQKKYLDALSGVAVNTLGHNHSSLVKVLKEQVSKLIHVSNYYNIEEQSSLAEELSNISQLSSTFFCNSGCEANEAAIKIARLHGHKNNINSPDIIVMDRAWHGRSMATLSATGSRKAQAGFEPLMSGFVRVPYDDVSAVQKIANRKNNIVAIMIEPIQGEGGINIPKNLNSYLHDLRKICDQNNWLLIFDEVQCGIGRTGKWFAFQYSNIKPDVVTLAKGLASGVPIGACITNEKTANLLVPGKHGSTFGGNPLACVAALATLEAIEKESLMKNAITQGEFITNELEKNLRQYKLVKKIKHIGLMIGIELSVPCNDLIKEALDEGLLINVTADKVIRLLPPLIIKKDESKFLIETLTKLIINFKEKN